jgi:hypothetical protein
MQEYDSRRLTCVVVRDHPPAPTRAGHVGSRIHTRLSQPNDAPLIFDRISPHRHAAGRSARNLFSARVLLSSVVSVRDRAYDTWRIITIRRDVANCYKRIEGFEHPHPAATMLHYKMAQNWRKPKNPRLRCYAVKTTGLYSLLCTFVVCLMMPSFHAICSHRCSKHASTPPV